MVHGRQRITTGAATFRPARQCAVDNEHSPWRLCVAPMMDWTDRHCRYFHRLITRRARLYTEMVTTGALLHGDVARHLDFDAREHPVALQLGGSEPEDLAHCARLAQRWGYDEVNLNCGCPSERVQRGAFGACLMAEPVLVADCLAAMRDAADLPVTVKHRIGIDRIDSEDFVRDFVGEVARRSGCSVFIVHARNAWLQGLSPKQNREVPPLRYGVVHRLARDFPALTFVVNGGIVEPGQIAEQLSCADGVMVGRAAYHEPWSMAGWDRGFLGGAPSPTCAGGREAVEAAMVDYMVVQARDHGVAWPRVARHMLGLYNGQPGARRWRQVWSDHRLRDWAPPRVHAQATRARLAATAAAEECGPLGAAGPAQRMAVGQSEGLGIA
jgi:tRNA-dihydrouridine synthase A